MNGITGINNTYTDYGKFASGKQYSMNMQKKQMENEANLMKGLLI